MPKPAKPDKGPRNVRLDLETTEHQEVRLAAARCNISMAEFARQAVVEAARKVNSHSGK